MAQPPVSLVLSPVLPATSRSNSTGVCPDIHIGGPLRRSLCTRMHRTHGAEPPGNASMGKNCGLFPVGHSRLAQPSGLRGRIFWPPGIGWARTRNGKAWSPSQPQIKAN